MKKSLYLVLIFILPLFLFSSCITNKQKTYLQDNEAETYNTVPFERYKLCVNDEITYYLMTANQATQHLYNSRSTRSSSTNKVFRIYEDGNVILPSVGPVKIVGLTLREAEIEICKVFKGVAPDAEVKIALANNFFYVQGDLGKGQFVVYKENLNIYQALAMAGDISSIGDKSQVKIIRKGVHGSDEIKTFDLRKTSIIESEYYYIKPNDVIYISTNPNSFFRVESVGSFVSMFVAPLSLLILVLSTF